MDVTLNQSQGKYNGCDIESKHQASYLGVTLDMSLSWIILSITRFYNVQIKYTVLSYRNANKFILTTYLYLP